MSKNLIEVLKKDISLFILVVIEGKDRVIRCVDETKKKVDYFISKDSP